MASALNFIAVLCLTSGLWIGANALNNTQASNETQQDRFPLCLRGWTPFGHQCFMVYRSGKEWADAERFCTSLGGNLASLQTADEYQFIRDLIQRATGTQTPTWVGGYDAAKEGVWLWSDGSRFVFTGWASGEPNNVGGNENCMEINFGEADYVNDTNCDLKLSFVCATRSCGAMC